MIRDILAVVDNADAARPFIDQALAFARLHRATLDVAVLSPAPYLTDDLLPIGGMYIPESEAQRTMTTLVDKVDALIAGAKPAATVFGLADDVAWLAGDLRRSRRIADVVLVSAPEGWSSHYLRRRVVETALLGSGTPTIIMPSGRDLKAVRHAVFAWKPSPEANRALHDLIGVLSADAVVDVVIVGQKRDSDAGDEVVRHLTRHDMIARVHRLGNESMDDVDVIHDFAVKAGADLLAAGAFAHSRLREIVFGGVTLSLVEATALPTLLSR